MYYKECVKNRNVSIKSGMKKNYPSNISREQFEKIRPYLESDLIWAELKEARTIL